MKKKVVLAPCASCVKKFIEANGRAPLKCETMYMPFVKEGCECEECDREWAFALAGIPVPMVCPSFQESFWDNRF